MKYLSKNLYIFIAITLAALIRLWLNTPFNSLNGGGDSTGRILSLLEKFPNDLNWLTSTIWLPFYFFLYSIPLHLSYQLDSLFIFQSFLSIVLCWICYKCINQDSDDFYASIATFIIGLMPLFIMVTGSVLSELSFTLFVILSLFYCEKFRKTKLHRYILYSILSMNFASMIRYEGWVLMPFFAVYIIIITKKFYFGLLAILPFSFCAYTIESLLAEQNNQALSGMSTNHLESLPVNIKLGLSTLLSKLKQISLFHIQNSGFLLLLLPFVVRSKIKKLDPYLLCYFLLTGALFFGSLLDHIAFFDRYWLPSLILLNLVVLPWVIKHSSKPLKISILSSLLIFHGYSIVNYSNDKNQFNTTPVFDHLLSLDAKNVYIDDFHSSYKFYGFKVDNFFGDKKINILHYDDNLSLIFHKEDEFNMKLRDNFLSIYQAQPIDHIVLIKNSRLSKILLNESVISFSKHWRKAVNIGNFTIYERNL